MFYFWSYKIFKVSLSPTAFCLCLVTLLCLSVSSPPTLTLPLLQALQASLALPCFLVFSQLLFFFPTYFIISFPSTELLRPILHLRLIPLSVKFAFQWSFECNLCQAVRSVYPSLFCRSFFFFFLLNK